MTDMRRQAADILSQAFAGEAGLGGGEKPPAPQPQEPEPEELPPAAQAEAQPRGDEAEPIVEQAVEETPGQEAEGVAEENEIETLTQLAQALEVDPEYMYALKIPMSNGEKLSLGELKDRAAGQPTGDTAAAIESEKARLQHEYQERNRALEEQRAAILAQQQQQGAVNEEMRKHAQEAAMIQGQLENTGYWEELEKADPAQAALYRQKLQEGFARASQGYQTAAVKAQQDTLAQRQKVLMQERVKVLNAIPEWGDDNVRAKETEALNGYLVSVGYHPSEVQSLADSRAVVLARKAMLFDQMSRQAAPAETRVRKAPPTLKTGVGQRISGSSKQKVQDIIKRGKTLRRDRDKAGAVSDLLQTL